MRIVKFDHPCFLVEKDGRGILFDPVEFDNKMPEMSHIDAIIVTHLHGDHFQPEVLDRIMTVNPATHVFTTEDNAGNIKNSIIARGGDKLKVGEFEVEFYGHDHAEILPGQMPCQNIGAIIDGIFANSGDSFDIPPTGVEIRGFCLRFCFL